MRLKKVRVQNYRSILDTGEFDIEQMKTILVGANEAGKTAILQAIQKLSSGEFHKFDALRDYPRAKYNEITTGKVKIEDVRVVTGYYSLEEDDIAEIPDAFAGSTYVFARNIDNKSYHWLETDVQETTFSAISNDLTRLISHIETRVSSALVADPKNLLEQLKQLIGDKKGGTKLTYDWAKSLESQLDKVIPLIEDGNESEENRISKIKDLLQLTIDRGETLKICNSRLPSIVLFSNYYRVRPLIHLQHLADRVDNKILDDKYYDYGNLCLLKLLGFTARELSNLGRAQDPTSTDQNAVQKYRDQLDKRSYQLNAASVRLTNEIKRVWNPSATRPEAEKLRVNADGQYLKVVVEDDLGVEIELDQRSEGFQWLVSFFVVFFAEAEDKHENAILLLDEPGLSLHGLKQREFQTTISRLSEKNQTIFSTHSPFLVGSNELDIVRVVEMRSREEGTKVHTTVSAGDSAALLPLQEALGYDLASTLFVHQRNLILEGLTDYWYLQGVSELFKEGKAQHLDEKVALLPASSASKVVYFATILHSNKLKVAALLDSDSAGDQAAKQDTLVNALGNKSIIRTKDVYSGEVSKPEIEDLLRSTLISITKEEFGIDIQDDANNQAGRPIVDIITSAIPDFSKYKLSKAFLRWSQANTFDKLHEAEISAFAKLFEKINKALK